MTLFRYDAAILDRYPGLVGGVIHASGVHNGPTPPPLAAAFRDEAEAVRVRIGATPLSELPELAAWRAVFRGFGVDPTAYFGPIRSGVSDQSDQPFRSFRSPQAWRP